MRFLLVLILLFPFCVEGKAKQKKMFVTYEAHGRLGDQLLALVKACWVSAHTNLPIRYRDNEWLEGLKVSDLPKTIHGRLKPWKTMENIRQCRGYRGINVLYDFKDKKWTDHLQLQDFHGLRENQKCMSLFKQLASLKNPKEYTLVYPPKNMFSVAIHVRMNEKDHSYDTLQIHHDPSSRYVLHKPGGPAMDLTYPSKMPPLQYYVDQLNRIARIKSDENFYVYIFTDHTNPRLMSQLILKNLDEPSRFQFGYRKGKFQNSLKATYEDFYSLLNFDALIRPMMSNFSQMAQLLADYKMVIYPTDYEVIDNCLIMKGIKIDK